MVNHGVIDGKKDTDYVAGVLPYVIRVPDGHWDSFIPPGMRQYNLTGDDMSCVSHSDIESIQTQEKWFTGSSPKYSIRWIAKKSGTTIQGNRLDTVVDTVRKYGLVRYESYPNPVEPWTFDQFHAEIPPELEEKLLAEGQEWLKQWAVSYEWVDISGIWFGDYSEIKKQLMHAPLQVVDPGHARLQIRNINDIKRVLDTYEPFIREDKQAQITSALKIVLTPLKGQRMSNAKLVKMGSEYGFYSPVINPSGLISAALNYGIQIPLNPDGSVNFAEVDKLLAGTVVPK